MTTEILLIFLRWFIPFACAGIFGYIIKELKENKNSNNAMKSAMLSLIRSDIVGNCEKYKKQGFLPENDRYCLEELHKEYKSLGGNHGIEVLVEECYRLPTSKGE